MDNLTIIRNCVCRAREVSPMMLNYKTRKREVVIARQLCYYFAVRIAKLQLRIIGWQIGGKDHATVLHGCRVINNLIDTDKGFATDVEELEKDIKKEIERVSTERRKYRYNKFAFNARFSNQSTRLMPIS